MGSRPKMGALNWLFLPQGFMLWNSISNVLENTEIIEMWIKRIWNFLCLAPLSAIFQLYRDI
jgi:hypothetical protein